MRYNATYSTYRWTETSGKWAYSGSATLSNMMGFFATLDGKTKATLGLDHSAEAFYLLTAQTNLIRKDKVVIDSVNYYVEAVEQINMGSQKLSKILINKDHE